DFEPLSGIDGVTLISLQKQVGLDELAELGGRLKIVNFADEQDEAHGPFMDTAAMIDSLDLVIACDSSVAHLAGALARKVWVALTDPPDWRWMMDREDTPWYPSMRLFRRQRDEDWSRVIATMRTELASLAGG